MDIYLPLRRLNVKSVLENPFFLFGFTSDIRQIMTDREGDRKYISDSRDS